MSHGLRSYSGIHTLRWCLVKFPWRNCNCPLVGPRVLGNIIVESIWVVHTLNNTMILRLWPIQLIFLPLWALWILIFLGFGRRLLLLHNSKRLRWLVNGWISSIWYSICRLLELYLLLILNLLLKMLILLLLLNDHLLLLDKKLLLIWAQALNALNLVLWLLRLRLRSLLRRSSSIRCRRLDRVESNHYQTVLQIYVLTPGWICAWGGFKKLNATVNVVWVSRRGCKPLKSLTVDSCSHARHSFVEHIVLIRIDNDLIWILEALNYVHVAWVYLFGDSRVLFHSRLWPNTLICIICSSYTIISYLYLNCIRSPLWINKSFLLILIINLLLLLNKQRLLLLLLIRISQINLHFSHILVII